MSIHQAFKKPRLDIHSLASAAVLTALSVVLTRFASVMALGGQSIRIGIGAIPLVLAGLLLGPVAGGMAGISADLIGVMINLMGASFHPGFSLTSLLTGLLPGLVMMAFKNKLEAKTVVFAWLAVTLICSVALQTLWLSQMQGNPYWTVLLTRMTLLPFVQGAHLLILLAILPVIKRLPIAQRLLGKRTNTSY